MPNDEVKSDAGALDRELYLHIRDLTNSEINWRESDGFDKRLENYEKRFEGMRSIRGLDYGDLPKTSPWPGCSDVGIPIDAITIQSIVARTDRVEFERLPLTHVTAVAPNDMANAPKIEAFLDWQKLNLMRIRIPKLMSTRSALILGSSFFKMVFEENYVWDEEEMYALADPDGGGLLKDDKGEYVEWDPEAEVPLNDNMHAYQVVEVKRTFKRPTYRGPKAYSRDPRKLLWPHEETSPDPDSWDWWADLYDRSVEWLETKGVEQGLKNVDQLSATMQKKSLDNGGNGRIDKKKLVKIREWYGQYELNGKMRYIVALIAPEYDVFLGYTFDKVRQKTGMTRLIHRCPLPMEGSSIGMSFCKFMKGLRDAIDALTNQMLDRASKANHPPIIYAHGSGFSPLKHNFGYRFWPEKVPGTIRELPMQHTDANEMTKIQMFIQLIQRLFGVTDTTAGVETPENQTATGITSLLAEGNVNIDMIIQALNESNIKMDELTIALNCIYLERDEDGKALPIEFPVIDDYATVMEDPDNPFATVSEDELMGKYNFITSGSSLSINTRSLREEAGFLYKTGIETAGANPFMQDLNVLHELTSDYFKSFGKKNIRIPSVEEIEQKMAAQQQAQAQAAMVAEQAKVQGEVAKNEAKAKSDAAAQEQKIKADLVKEAMRGRNKGK